MEHVKKINFKSIYLNKQCQQYYSKVNANDDFNVSSSYVVWLVVETMVNNNI